MTGDGSFLVRMPEQPVRMCFRISRNSALHLAVAAVFHMTVKENSVEPQTRMTECGRVVSEWFVLISRKQTVPESDTSASAAFQKAERYGRRADLVETEDLPFRRTAFSSGLNFRACAPRQSVGIAYRDPYFRLEIGVGGRLQLFRADRVSADEFRIRGMP